MFGRVLLNKMRLGNNWMICKQKLKEYTKTRNSDPWMVENLTVPRPQILRFGFNNDSKETKVQ